MKAKYFPGNVKCCTKVKNLKNYLRYIKKKINVR